VVPDDPHPGRPPVRRDAAGRRHSGNPAAAAAIDLFADRLGLCVGITVAIMDPQRVVIGGGMSGSFDRLAPGLTKRLSRVVLLPPSVVPSRLGTEAGLIGAIEAAMERADTWLLESIVR
jgi:predicted NBD/HSP70 family sugar kinase